MADKPSREASQGRAEPSDLGGDLERGSIPSSRCRRRRRRRLHCFRARRQARRQRRRHPRQRPRPDHRLSHHRGRERLADQPRGRLVPAHALAIDPDTGFGLAQALDRLDPPALPLGRSNEAKSAIPSSSPRRASQFVARLGGRQARIRRLLGVSLDEAIFTAPAHPFWGGAALIGLDGKLLGVGSLHVEQPSDPGQPREANMIVPIDLLPPILDDLLARGRVDRPPRPWLGVYSAEGEGRVVIAAVDERGPAAAAGLRRGDIIAAVGEARVARPRRFLSRIWSCGPAGGRSR